MIFARVFIAVYCDFIVEDRADGKVMHLRHLGFCRSRAADCLFGDSEFISQSFAGPARCLANGLQIALKSVDQLFVGRIHGSFFPINLTLSDSFILSRIL